MDKPFRKPIIYFKLNHCLNCNRDEIELYNQFGKPLNYSRMIMDRYNPNGYSLYPNVVISMCKCKACGKKYMLSYDMHDHFPIPITFNEYIVDPFLNSFYNLGIQREHYLNKRKGDMK